MVLHFVLAFTLLATTANVAGRVLLTLYALSLGAQPVAVGMLAATYALFPATLSWPVGMLADRFGSRWPLLIGTIWTGLALATAYAFSSLAVVYLAGALIGLSTAFENVTLQNLTGLLSKPEKRTVNYSYFGLIIASAFFVGPLMVGLGIDHLGYKSSALCLIVLVVLPLFALLVIGGRLPQGSRSAKRAGGLLHTLGDRNLLRVLATSSLIVTGVELFGFYMPVYGHSIGLSASAIGVVLATYAAAAFVVRLSMQALLRPMTDLRLLAHSFHLSMLSLLLIPFFENVYALALLAFLFGLGMGCGQPITMMMTFSGSAQGRSGEVMGLRVAVNQSTRVVVPILFGFIASVIGLSPVFWIYAVMLGTGSAFSRPAGAAAHPGRKE